MRFSSDADMNRKFSSYGHPSLAALLARAGTSTETSSSQTQSPSSSRRRRCSFTSTDSDQSCEASLPFFKPTNVAACPRSNKVAGTAEPIAPLPFYSPPAAEKTGGDIKAFMASKIKAAEDHANNKKRVLQAQHPQEFVSKYEVTKPVIAKGSTCYVMEVRKSVEAKRDDDGRPCSGLGGSDDRYACKVVDLTGRFTNASAPSRPSPDCEIGTTKVDSAAVEGATSLEDAMKEFDVLRNMGSHPGILKLHDVIWSASNDKCYMVTALANGGTLQTKINRCGMMDEEEVKIVMQQIFDALAHLHDKGILHRDLKLENIFIHSPMPSSGQNKSTSRKTHHVASEVQIGDFGMAKFLQKANESAGEHTICGSPQSAAPEMLNPPQVCPATGKKLAAYGRGVDMWACGVMMYTMLSGKPPFTGEGIMDLFRSIKSGKFDLDSYVWPIVSDEAKALLRGLLACDPRERLSARESLNHPWIVSADDK